MSAVSWAGTSICPKCKRMVKHKPRGGPHRWHGCRIRWIKRRVERRYFEGWYEGYEFALENISDPMVYADLNEYGTGWAGLAKRGGITIEDDAPRRARVQVNYPTREELEAKREAILAAHPDLAKYAEEGSLAGEEWAAWAELGDIEWLLGGEPS